MVQIEVGKNSVPEVGSLPVPPTASLVHGIRIVSREQLLLDLMREGGVCVQAVEEMVRLHAVS